MTTAVGSGFTGDGRGRLWDHALARPRAAWLLLWLAVGLTGSPLYFVMGFCTVKWAGLSDIALMALGCGVGFLSGALGFAPKEAADIPARLVGLTRTRGRLLAGVVVAFGALPWFLPSTVRLPGAVGFPALCLEWLIGAAVFVVLAALISPGRALRGTAGAVLLAVLLGWMPLRQLVIAAADTAALDSFGGPPRELVRVVDWPGMQPESNGYARGIMTIEYDYLSLLPSPGGDFGTLTVQRAESLDPCTVLRADDDGGPTSACRSLGAGLWTTGDCALALHTGGVLVQLVESDCVPGEESTLESIIRTQRPANDLELLSIGR